MEEKSREIQEVAEGYAGHHWAAWTALPILVLGILLVTRGCIEVAGALVPLLGLPEGSAQARRWMLILWGALALVTLVAYGGWFIPRYQRWVTAKTGMKPKPEGPALSCLPIILLGPGIFVQRAYGLLVVSRVAASFYPLAWALFFDVVAGSYMLATWIRSQRNTLWRYSPPAVVVLGLFNLYAFAVALGLPQPGGGPRWLGGMSYRVIVPWASAFTAFGVIGWFHSRRQFRRLQHLVNEEGGPHD